MYVSFTEDGRIGATTPHEEYASEDMIEFDFPEDFDFSKQNQYRIEDDELIFDPPPVSEEEKAAEERAQYQSQLQTASVMFVRSNAKTFTNEQALSVSSLFEEWAKDTEYEKDQIIQHKGELYRIGQDHTSQEIYPPDAEGVTALYSHITIDEETGYEEWKPWDGVSGIYQPDQPVIDPNDGQVYISKIPNNVWGPPSQQPMYWELYKA